MRISRFAAATIVLSFAATAAIYADSRIEYKVTEGQGVATLAMLIGQGKIRSDADATTSVILDPVAGSMTMLDHAKKQFTRITRADIDRLVNLMAQMEQAMAGMPPEMREMMKGRMSGAGGAAPEVVDTGERASVGGRACRVFRTTIRGRVASESCMGDPSALQIPAADRATIEASMAWAKELTDKLAKGPMGQMFAAAPFRGGLVPLRVTNIGADGSRSTSEFTGVSNAAIPAEAFAVPAGYKEQKLDIPGGRGGRP